MKIRVFFFQKYLNNTSSLIYWSWRFQCGRLGQTDNDFGFLNTILMFGIAGFSLFIFFFAKLLAMLVSSTKRISRSNPYKTVLKVMILAWGGVLIGYFTTWDFFTWYFHKVFFIAVLIALSELFTNRAAEEELVIRYMRRSRQMLEWHMTAS